MKPRAKSRHLKFTWWEQDGSTHFWAVQAKRNGAGLGIVRWFPDWHCYTFYPHEETVFSDECLRDIADFCEARTDEYRKA